MKRIKLEIELTYDDAIMHCGEDDQESKEWFFDTILNGTKGELILHSNEIGNELGEVSVVKVIK